MAYVEQTHKTPAQIAKENGNRWHHCGYCSKQKGEHTMTEQEPVEREGMFGVYKTFNCTVCGSDAP